MQALHKEHGDYLQNQFSAFEAESKLMVATEVRIHCELLPCPFLLSAASGIN
jgi:hypothetical protein